MSFPSHKQIIFLTILIISSLTQNCSPNLQNDQMLAGSYVFKLSSSRIHCYNTTIPLNAAAPLQLIHGISKMDNFENSNFGFDFSFRGRIDTISKLLSFSLFVNNGTMNSISINYILISNRNEYIAGTYIADTLDCNKQQKALVEIPINSQILPNPSSTLAILVFINGIRTQSWIFNLKFQQPLIETDRTQINVTVIIDAIQPIQTLFLSYLIIDISRLSQSYSFSFTTSPVASDFNMIGILSFTNTSSPIHYAHININKTNNLACEGWNCSACLSTTNCISQGGNVFLKKCLKCGLNSVFNSQIGCVDCGVNASVANGRCNCKNGFFNISGICQNCPPGTIYSQNNKICSTVCTGGQQWISGACSCLSGTNLINGVCSTCPSGYSYNSTTSTCIIICSSNQVIVNNQCQCSPGFSLVNGVCQAASNNPSSQASTASQTNSAGIVCNANQYILNGICKCFSEFVQFDKSCLKCPQNSRVTPDQRGCVCNEGFVLLSGTKSCTAKQSSSSNLINTGSSTTSSTTASKSSNPSASSQATTTTASTSPASTNPSSSSISTASTTSSTTSTPTSASPSSLPSTLSSATSSSLSSASSSTSTSGSGSGSISSTSSIQTNPGNTQSSSSGSMSVLTSGCTPYCDLCLSTSICLSCNPYFYLNRSVISNYYSSLCLETCGDGRRFTLPCDDGNTINGDGCSNNCSIEQGWQCTGGSLSNKDICKLNSLTKIVLVNNIVLTNAAYQNVLVSNIPSNLLQNKCQKCSSILVVTLLQGPAQTIFRVDFVPSSYDLVKKEASYIITIITPAQGKSNINFRVALNRSMSQFFSQPELNQQAIGTIIFVTPQLPNVALASPPSPTDPKLPSAIDLNTSPSGNILPTPPSSTPTKSTVIPTESLQQNQQIIIPDIQSTGQIPLINA